MLVKIKAFLKLIRWFHEVVAILPFLAIYLVIRYFAKVNHIDCNLSSWHFIILCLCVQSLIAAGCVLNDIVDRDIDKINKPQTHIIDNTISLNSAKWIFAILSILSAALSIYIAAYLFIEWAFISAGVYILSLAYDLYLKRSPLFGNVLMALLSSFIPLVIFYFADECIESLNNSRLEVLIWIYAIFPFLIIIPRELSLDISDIDGDKACNCKTLPIILGVEKSKQIVAALIIFLISISIPTALKLDYMALPIFIIDAMLLIYLHFLKSTSTRIGYIRIGRFLWATMIIGLIMLSISTVLL